MASSYSVATRPVGDRGYKSSTPKPVSESFSLRGHGDYKCIVIHALMGKGRGCVDDFLRVSGMSCVWVTTGALHARDAVARLESLGFMPYGDDMGGRIVVAYEDIHKVTRNYDIVVLDEARDVCAQMNLPAGVNGFQNYLCALSLAQKSDQVIIVGASMDLDNGVQNMVSDIVTDRVIEVQFPAPKRMFEHTPNGQAIRMMMSDLAGGKRVVACFGSVECMGVIMKIVHDSLGDRITSCTYSDVSSIETIDFDFDFVGYTPQGFTGIYSEREVVRVYGFPKGDTNPFRFLGAIETVVNVSTGKVIMAM